MSLAVLYSRAVSGVQAPLVTVETHIANGLPSFTIVGLPDTEVKESKDRVRAALQNAQFKMPAQRITVNLAPADLPKESGRFDLPIALGILAATGQIPGGQLDQYEWAGELALTGELRPIHGALAMTYNASQSGRSFVLPQQNAAEAALVDKATIYAAKSLLQVCAHLSGHEPLPVYRNPPESDSGTQDSAYPDLDEVKGQTHAGNCRRRRTQPVDDRPAGHRKIDAGGAFSRHSAAYDRARSPAIRRDSIARLR